MQLTGPTEASPVPTPAISILSSAYRTEDKLEAMILSVLAQTRSDWELIVVDNGPSDTIASIVQRYTDDSRIRLIRQTNSGVSGGVNAAAAQARGTYLVVLHSDDQLTPEYCSRMGGILDDDPAIDVVCCDAHLISASTGEPLHHSFRTNLANRRFTARVTLTDLLAGRPLYYVGAFRRAAWAAGGGYSSDPPNIEDRLLYLRILGAGGSIVEIPDRLSRYMLDDNSATYHPDSSRQMQRSLEQVHVEAARASGRPQDLAALEVGLRRSRYVQALRRARFAFIAGDVSEARTEARQALAQRWTLRAGAVFAGLTVAPGVLRLVHPTKRMMTERFASFGARTVRRVASR
ncbi:glycosyl transferase family 2 [Pseudonocardia sediminis]|uniref:Glycosyl transferase family 2 n=1 Tax=Pseudonocardia sediminis TaxID=1397368 RepID=A0A4Q7V535_PSEST|nr:glycosyltransferase family 2 protein [Pseudonocardia sediminis]RZT87873.1 glycosyl transferase family 2 [Pseudonocardia sediminis]